MTNSSKTDSVRNLLSTQTGQHSPLGTSRVCPSSHTGFRHVIAEQFCWHTAQHSPGGTTTVSPSSQSSSVMVRQSTAAQSGRVQTGQHSPGGVSRTSPSLHSGFKQEQSIGGGIGGPVTGACLFSMKGVAEITPREQMEIRSAKSFISLMLGLYLDLGFPRPILYGSNSHSCMRSRLASLPVTFAIGSHPELLPSHPGLLSSV